MDKPSIHHASLTTRQGAFMLIVLSVVPFVAAAVLALLVNALIPSLGLAWSWIIGVSIASFFTYGYDKSIAGRGVTRVPEVVLHLLTAVGGTIGSFAGMQLFRHKTQKKSFQIVFWAIVAIQVVVLILLLMRR
jgi:uncharacterized membrane protein YsdA (DUF1294 family)